MSLSTENKKIYVVVPLSVQYTPYDPFAPHLSRGLGNRESHSRKNTAGYLAAQAVHAGRKLDRQLANMGYGNEPITTIVLTVRNSKELEKISTEVASRLWAEDEIGFTFFDDTNADVYGFKANGQELPVRTAIAFGPVTSETVDEQIGHLELLP